MLKFEQLITSRQNPAVKRICALSEKKKRAEEGLFRFDGIKLFREAVEAGLDIKYVVIRQDVSENIERSVEEALRGGLLKKEALMLVTDAVFEKISEERAPEGIITVASFLTDKHRKTTEISADEGERILIAESLRDAGNLGTVIRSCAALGIDRLILSDDCADIYNSKTVRSAMGGLFRLNIDMIEIGKLGDVIRQLRSRGRRVYAAALREDAEKIGSLALGRGDCFVIGNEGHGLSDATIDACDGCAIIPMAEGSESLNAAAAAAICIWETVKNA